MTWDNNKKLYHEKLKNEARFGGREERLKKEHQKGKLTARERIDLLFDEGTFQELETLSKSGIEISGLEKKQYPGDGVVTGFGKIHGHIVYAASQDCTVSGGSGGETHIKKITNVLQKAIDTKSPFICLCDSGGARIEEGILALSAYSTLFRLNTMASGYIPQISAIMGNCAGGSSYSPAMMDFTFMVEKTSQFFITGPKVIHALTGENVTMDELGGTEIHEKHSGQAHVVCENDKECIHGIRELLSYIVNKKEDCPKKEIKVNGNAIEEIVPENTRYSYDVKKVIDCIVDRDSFFEVQREFAKNIVIGFSRIAGRSIGIVANQASVMGGSLDCDASDKAARFIRFCDAFEIPLLVMVDVPGFYPGVAEEKKGVLRHGSKLLYAFAEANVPKITLIMRKAYGGAYCAMNSKALGADIVYAWPICEIAVMGAEGAVDVLYHKQISNAENQEAYRNEKIEAYKEEYLNPYYAASVSLVDEVILPCETRERLIKAFDALDGKKTQALQKKHGNIPL